MLCCAELLSDFIDVRDFPVFSSENLEVNVCLPIFTYLLTKLE